MYQNQMDIKNLIEKTKY